MKSHHITWGTVKLKRIYPKKLSCISKASEICAYHLIKKAFFNVPTISSSIDIPGRRTEFQYSSTQKDYVSGLVIIKAIGI